MASRFQALRLHEAVARAWLPVVHANEFIERVKPWVVAKDESRREELGDRAGRAARDAAARRDLVVARDPDQERGAVGACSRLPGSPADSAARPPRRASARRSARELGEVESLFPRIELPARA